MASQSTQTASDSLMLPLQNAPVVGTPRFGKYNKRISRLYEVLFLLAVLGKTRGRPSREPVPVSEEQKRQRRFLNNLAFILDSERGGKSCTAIGLEDSAAAYRFWVASNAENCRGVDFASQTLKSLVDYASEDWSEAEREKRGVDIWQSCVVFAKKRIHKETKCLEYAIRECRQKLENQDASTEAVEQEKGSLLKWLEHIVNESSNDKRCEFAYEALKRPYMRMVEAEGEAEDESRLSQHKQGPFSMTRHLIRKLAKRAKVHRELLEDAMPLKNMLSTSEVCAVEPVPSVPSPQPDSLTSVEGILKRMLKCNDEEREAIESRLIMLDGVLHIRRRYMLQFKNCIPTVHAEIQILEHFYSNKLNFAQGDRFIGCSKAACLCCKLYFRHHPARMVVPASHEKVYPNWGPPLLVSKIDPSQPGCEDVNQGQFKGKGNGRGKGKGKRKGELLDEESRRQRDILNSMISDLRDDAVSQIWAASHPPPWHTDSATAVSDFSAIYVQSSHLIDSELWESGRSQLSHATTLPLSPPLSNNASDRGGMDSGDDTDDEDGGAPL